MLLKACLSQAAGSIVRTGEADASAVDWRGASRKLHASPTLSSPRRVPSDPPRERSQPKQCRCNSSLRRGLLVYDPSAVFIDGTGISKADLAALAPKLEAARAETLADLDLLTSKGNIPTSKEPLDARFIDLPERLLAEYKQDRRASEVGRILATAARIREAVDRVVVLGIGGSYMGARALLEACCHPYHNELSRGERGGKPRMFFEGNNVDNDAAQGLLDVLGHGRAARDVAERWAIVVISKSGGTLETAAAFRIFLEGASTVARQRSSAGRAACGAGDRPERAVV